MRVDKLLATALLLVLAQTAAASDECPLVGVWKSNEAKTLASLHATGKVNPQQRRLFENHYFGNLTVRFTCTEMISSYAGESEIMDYKYVNQDGNRLTIQIENEDDNNGKVRVFTLEPDGKCYSVPVSNLGFRQYFCRH